MTIVNAVDLRTATVKCPRDLPTLPTDMLNFKECRKKDRDIIDYQDNCHWLVETQSPAMAKSVRDIVGQFSERSQRATRVAWYTLRDETELSREQLDQIMDQTHAVVSQLSDLTVEVIGTLIPQHFLDEILMVSQESLSIWRKG